MLQKIVHGNTEYSGVLCLHCGHGNRHPSGLAVCTKRGEDSKKLLDKLRNGTLAFPCFLEPGQKLLCPALDKLIVNNLVGFSLQRQSFILKSAYALYYHLAGFVHKNYGGWTMFAKSCRSQCLAIAAKQFPNGLVSEDMATKLYFFILGLNWENITLKDTNPDTLEEVVLVCRWTLTRIGICAELVAYRRVSLR